MSIYHFRAAFRGYRERRKGAARASRRITLNYTKSLFWIIVKSICSYRLYYIIFHYTAIYYYIRYTAILLYIILYAIMCYYGIMLWYTMVICFNAIICNYRGSESYYIMPLCAGTFKRLFAAALMGGKCDLLSKNIQNFFI